jgi:hypothetical protein
MSAETPTKIKLSEGETEILTKALLQAQEDAKRSPAKAVPIGLPKPKAKSTVKKSGPSLV